MLKKLLENKKLVIAIIAIVIIVIVALLVRCGSNEPTGTDSGSDKEIKQEEAYDGDGLEIIEDDGKSENGIDISEYWEDTKETGNDADKNDTKKDDTAADKTTNSETGDNKTEGGDSAGNGTEGTESEGGVSGEESLQDEKSWGAIY